MIDPVLERFEKCFKQHLINRSEASEVKYDTSDDMTLVKVDTHLMLPENMTKEELDAKKNSLMEKVEDGISSWICTVCGKTAKTKQHMKMHVETHMEGLSYPCNNCGKISRSSNQLNTHVSMFHRK